MWKNHNFHNSYLDVIDIMIAWITRHVYLHQLMALAFATTYVTHICSKALIANIFVTTEDI